MAELSWESLGAMPPAERAVDFAEPSAGEEQPQVPLASGFSWDDLKGMPTIGGAIAPPVTESPASFPGAGPFPSGQYEKFSEPRKTAEQMREWVTEAGASLPGLPIDAYNLLDLGGRKLTSMLPRSIGGNPDAMSGYDPIRAGSGEWFKQPMRDIGAIDNPYLKPEGHLAKATVEGATAGSPFGLPGMAAGAGGGFASEALGQYYRGSPGEIPARLGGAVLGGLGLGALSKVAGRGVNMLRGEVNPAAQTFKDAGIHPSLASDITDSSIVAGLEGAVGKTMAGGHAMTRAATADVTAMKDARDAIAQAQGTRTGGSGARELPETIGSGLREGVIKAYDQFQENFDKLKQSFNSLIGDPTKFMVPPTNTISTLERIGSRFTQNPELGKEVIPAVFDRVLGKIKQGQTTPGYWTSDPVMGPQFHPAVTKPPAVTWDELEAFRTYVGEQAFGKNLVRSEGGPTEGQWKQLYGALTGDMKAALKPGSAAERAFNENNALYAAEKTQFGHLKEIQDLKKSPEKVFNSAISETRSGGSKLATLERVLKRTPEGQQTWNNLVANQIYSLGAVQDGGFSIAKFLTAYTNPKSGLSEGAKNVLFKDSQAELNKLAEVARNMKKSEKYANPPGTAATMHTLEIIAEGGPGLVAAMTGDVATGLSIAGGMLAAPAVVAKAMTNPWFIKWLSTPVPAGMQSAHWAKLSQIPGMEQIGPILQKKAEQSGTASVSPPVR